MDPYIKIFIDSINKILPDLTVTFIAKYNDDYFLFEAVKDPSKRDYNDPYYIVNKKTFAVSPFIPSLNPKAFKDAIENHLIWAYNYSSFVHSILDKIGDTILT